MRKYTYEAGNCETILDNITNSLLFKIIVIERL